MNEGLVERVLEEQKVTKAFRILSGKGVSPETQSELYHSFNQRYLNDHRDEMNLCIDGKASMQDYFERQDNSFLEFANNYRNERGEVD